jgi:hypothetical protein
MFLAEQCSGSGMFIPNPRYGSKNFSFRIPDPKIFHPGSFIKRGMKNTGDAGQILVSGKINIRCIQTTVSFFFLLQFALIIKKVLAMHPGSGIKFHPGSRG